MDFCSNDISSEAKTKGRNLQNKMAEFYQYYFMLIYMYNDFMITITLCLYICTMLSWLQQLGVFIDNASNFFNYRDDII